MRRSYSFLPVALVLFALAGQALADIQPSFDHAMAAWRATDIVVAVDGKPIAGSLTVSEVWAGKLAVGNTLSLPQVSRLYSEAMWEGAGPGADRGKLAETSPQRVVLFLMRLPPKEGEETPAWRPAAEVGGMKASVAWLTKDGVYAFAQVMNPGPTVLTRYGRHTEATLREQVKGVLAIRSRLGRPGDELARARATIAMMKREMAKLMVERDSNLDRRVVAQNELKNLAESAEQMTKEYSLAIDQLEKIKRRLKLQCRGCTLVLEPEPPITIRGKITAIDRELRLVVIEDQVFEVVDELKPGKPIQAKVTAVDTKLGLVVIDAGRRKGVTKGTELIVFRGDKYVGKVAVDEVFPDISACHYIGNGMLFADVGDNVTTKLAPEAARPERVDPPPLRRKKVTAVDPKLGLVVIDAGQRQGVTEGTVLIVFRGDRFVGQIIVDKVFPDVSNCRYGEIMKEDVQVGDEAAEKLTARP